MMKGPWPTGDSKGYKGWENGYCTREIFATETTMGIGESYRSPPPPLMILACIACTKQGCAHQNLTACSSGGCRLCN